jgi:multidrug efflux pump subunit AcrA (membrane-fusion protein)
MIVWASIFKIIQTARAQGQVIAIARTQVIQAAIDGVIQAVLVQEGQIVKKGDILVRMDDQQVEAGLTPPTIKYNWMLLKQNTSK